MKILIIKAHPSTKGFTHRITNAYRKAKEKLGNDVEVLDLYKTDFKQDYLTFENLREIPFDPICDVVQAKIKEADELVFVHPMWWFTMPAIMKNFIDVNFGLGFAYKYKKFPILKGVPIGLLRGKTARIFVTCDGAKWMYKLIMSPYKFIWKYGILRFVGIKTKSITLFDRMRWKSPEELEKRLENVRKIAKA